MFPMQTNITLFIDDTPILFKMNLRYFLADTQPQRCVPGVADQGIGGIWILLSLTIFNDLRDCRGYLLLVENINFRSTTIGLAFFSRLGTIFSYVRLTNSWEGEMGTMRGGPEHPQWFFER